MKWLLTWRVLQQEAPGHCLKHPPEGVAGAERHGSRGQHFLHQQLQGELPDGREAVHRPTEVAHDPDDDDAGLALTRSAGLEPLGVSQVGQSLQTDNDS